MMNYKNFNPEHGYSGSIKIADYIDEKVFKMAQKVLNPIIKKTIPKNYRDSIYWEYSNPDPKAITSHQIGWVEWKYIPGDQ